MDIVVEQSKLADPLVPKVTYQEPFPTTVLCGAVVSDQEECGNQALLIMLVHDDEKLLVGQRPAGVKVWPHDASVIAIYLCTECGVMRVRWNQS